MSSIHCLLNVVLICALAALSPTAGAAIPDILTRQIHIAFGYTPSTVVVNFLTPTSPLTSVVEYGLSPSALNVTVPASFHSFTDGGALRTNRTVHSATLAPLSPSTRFHYRVTTSNATSSYSSEPLSFRTPSATVGVAAATPLRIGLLGDWGLVNGSATHSSLQRLVDRDALDLLIHVGDISYNLERDNGNVGDAFMAREQSVVGRLPYAVAPGNHEGAYNFRHFVERFSRPSEESGSHSPMYYSFNVGPVHFVAIDAERYFVPDSLRVTSMPTMDDVREQYEWLQADLEKAVRNRRAQPWIVAFGHRPLYCSHIHGDWQNPWCTEDAAAVRDGVAFKGGPRLYGLEALFRKYSVDLYAAGHMHSYERTYPVYRGEIVNRHFRDNEATFHLVVGASGCQGPMDDFDNGALYPWSAARSDSYGYGILTAHNETHLHWAQILDEDESVMDELWVVKAAPKKDPAVERSTAARKAWTKLRDSSARGL